MANKELVAMINKLDAAIDRISDHNKKKAVKQNGLEDLDISSLNLSDEDKMKLSEDLEPSSSITFDDTDKSAEAHFAQKLRVVGRPALTERQRDIVQKRSSDVLRSFDRVDQTNPDAVAFFWKEVEADLMEDEGLTNVGLRNTVYILRDITEKASIANKTKSHTTQVSEPVPVQDDVESVTSSSIEPADAHVVKNDEQSSEQAISGDIVQKEEIAKTLAELRNAYDPVPVGQVQIEQQKSLVEAGTLYDSVHKKIEVFDVATEARAEKMGGKIHEIVKGFSKFYARFTPKIKRAFVASMVIGGILLGSVTNLHKDKEDYGVHNSHATVEQINTSYKNSDTVVKNDVPQGVIQEKLIDEKDTKDEKVSAKTVIDHVAETTSRPAEAIIVEKNSSIIGSLTKYLSDNPDLLKNSHKTSGQMAFILAQNYNKDHRSINLDKVYPGTQIDLDVAQDDSNGTNLCIKNIEFVNGPHLQADQSKIKYDVEKKLGNEKIQNGDVSSSDDHEVSQISESQVYDDSVSQNTFDLTPQMELQKVKEIMADATLGQKFKQDVFGRIGDILGIDSMQFTSSQEENTFIKRIALASVQDVKNMDLDPDMKKRVQNFLHYSDAKYGLNNDQIKFASYLSRVIFREQMSVQRDRNLSA